MENEFIYHKYQTILIKKKLKTNVWVLHNKLYNNNGK